MYKRQGFLFAEIPRIDDESVILFIKNDIRIFGERIENERFNSNHDANKIFNSDENTKSNSRFPKNGILMKTLRRKQKAQK